MDNQDENIKLAKQIARNIFIEMNNYNPDSLEYKKIDRVLDSVLTVQGLLSSLALSKVDTMDLPKADTMNLPSKHLKVMIKKPIIDIIDNDSPVIAPTLPFVSPIDPIDPIDPIKGQVTSYSNIVNASFSKPFVKPFINPFAKQDKKFDNKNSEDNKDNIKYIEVFFKNVDNNIDKNPVTFKYESPKQKLFVVTIVNLHNIEQILVEVCAATNKRIARWHSIQGNKYLYLGKSKQVYALVNVNSNAYKLVEFKINNKLVHWSEQDNYFNVPKKITFKVEETRSDIHWSELSDKIKESQWNYFDEDNTIQKGYIKNIEEFKGKKFLRMIGNNNDLFVIKNINYKYYPYVCNDGFLYELRDFEMVPFVNDNNVRLKVSGKLLDKYHKND